jgi:hypothetical protein
MSKAGVCPVCNKHGPLTVDHIIPRLFGGAGYGTRLICADCNIRRGHRIGLKEWAIMNSEQRSLFWGWLKGVLNTRLNNTGYRFARPEAASRDVELLNRLCSEDFDTLLPYIEAANIPGFK